MTPPVIGATSRGAARLLRPSLRVLMVLVLVAGLGLGWIAQRAGVQRSAVRAITAAGGRALYPWEVKAFKGRYSVSLTVAKLARPPVPSWLIRLLGPDYFGSIRMVYVAERGCNAVMGEVARLDNLEQMYMRSTYGNLPPIASNLTDSGLAKLRRLRHLKAVMITGNPGLKGPGLVGLSGSVGLRRVIVHDVPIQDDDLRHLQGLTSLTELELTDTRITDAGLAHFEGMTAMRCINLNHSRVTGAGLAHLRGMTGLIRLVLGWTRVDDLAAVAHLTKLQQLMLAACPIDDAGIRPAHGFITLRSLVLRQTRVSDAELRSLRESLPKTSIAN